MPNAPHSTATDRPATGAMSHALRALVSVGLVVPLAIALMGSDHRDGPGTTADRAADIADLYAFHDLPGNKLTTVLTFAGLGAAGAPAVYDPDVVYTINIDTNADQTPEFSLKCHFSTSGGNTLLMVDGLPGRTGTTTSQVEAVTDTGAGQKLFAGLRDDPFFFDLDGFHMTLDKAASDSTLLFNNTRDFFAGTNVTAIVLEMKLSDVTASGANPNLQLWATTERSSIRNAMIPALHHDDQALVARK